MRNSKRVVIIIGPPGSGKGTQASLLAEKLNLYHLESSKVIETKIAQTLSGKPLVIRKKKYFIDEEKKKWQTGFLCAPEVVAFWMKERIRELAEEGKNLIFSGSPRTLFEAEELIPLLARLYGKKNIKIVFLEVSGKESVFRNSRRKLCSLMRHPILFSRQNAKLAFCPLDGSKLSKRKGLDDPETIKTRLRVYREQTLPLREFFKKRKLVVKEVNGMPAPAVVFANILKALGEKK